jgi:hypothetical protein
MTIAEERYEKAWNSFMIYLNHQRFYLSSCNAILWTNGHLYRFGIDTEIFCSASKLYENQHDLTKRFISP